MWRVAWVRGVRWSRLLGLQDVPPSEEVLEFWRVPGLKVGFVLELKLPRHYGLDVVLLPF